MHISNSLVDKVTIFLDERQSPRHQCLWLTSFGCSQDKSIKSVHQEKVGPAPGVANPTRAEAGKNGLMWFLDLNAKLE